MCLSDSDISETKTQVLDILFSLLLRKIVLCAAKLTKEEEHGVGNVIALTSHTLNLKISCRPH